ncbi:hypothetical protein GCM10009117_14660 [Gangjinia marincola]|uniref:Fibronectin type-III domain-containing protein n=1 Tax=Gangjinia marincola TaxID=578463 RepID=A0ABN1MGT8_9FLAO
MKRFNLYILLAILSFSSYAQVQVDSVGLPVAEIKVTARPMQDRIMIRWAPTTPIAWKKLNGFGYTIERYTISRDGTSLDTPVKQILTPNPIRPQGLDEWMTIIEENDNAAIVAQALYGEDFEVTGGSQIERLVALSQGLQQRYTFTLYTVEQDFEVARMAGLGYVDRTAVPTEKYLYRVISKVPNNVMSIPYGGVFTGISEYKELPKPVDFVGVFGDRQTILSWNRSISSKFYTAFNIERSTDGVSFKKINPRPYSNIENQSAGNRATRIFYLDSINNANTYYYRIQGISTFGEKGPYSDVVSGSGEEILQYVPHLTIKELLSDNKVKLTWEFPVEGNNKIKGFELNKSDGRGETIKVVIRDISPSARSVEYEGLAASNYFTISAIGKNNSNRTSFPILVQPVDSIPPAVPSGLRGKVDSLGVVTLTWKKNTEEDFLGYRIFKGSNKNEEFSQITASPIQDSSYVDTININNLNPNIFYTVASVDMRYNTSKASSILVLEKPDVIPPTSPAFKTFKSEDNGISLNWAKSSSKDAIETLLYRKQNEESSWNLIATLPNIQERFVDVDIEEGNLYSYTIVSRDQSGLESVPSQPIVINLPKLDASGEIKGFYAQANRNQRHIQLSWRYKGDLDEVSGFTLYKAIADSKLSMLRELPADSKLIYDNGIRVNTAYTYAIRANYKDGRLSKMKLIEVKY